MPKDKDKDKDKKKIVYASWEEMPIEVFREKAAIARQKAEAFKNDIEELFPGLVTLTRQQRMSAPKMRDGEHAMYQRVLDAADKKPALFESLADADEGMDPTKFETPLLRERVEKHLLFRQIGAVIDPLSRQVGDSSLYLAGKFVDAVRSAYRIAKTHAQTDKGINDILAPVIDFMRKGAVAAAASRRAKKDG